MSRIAARFAALRAQGRKALIPYITAGDPHPDLTVDLLHTLVGAGADLLELGVPFSDPMADGPVIQAACERALQHHVSLRKVLEMVRVFRAADPDTPVVLMGYLNPIEVMGYRAFATAASEAGVDGVLIVDMPPEEGSDLVDELTRAALDPIFLAAPTTHADRLRVIAAAGKGFVYYVSLKGVTGAATLDVDAVAAKLAAMREWVDLPLGVGFGIRDAATAARVAKVADAVVVGSALVARIAAHASDPARIHAELAGLVRQMRDAMDAAASAPIDN
ncbi:MAG: tryptophan synthase subunit alpha [Thiotrichales bacterium]